MTFKILVLALFAYNSFAINLQKFHFSNSPVYATVEDALLEDGLVTTDYKYILVGSYNYVRSPFIEIDGNNRTGTIIEWMNTFNLGGAYKFSNSFQVGFSSYFSYVNAIPSDESSSYKKKFVLGDLTVDFKYKIYESNKLALAFTPRIYLASGDEKYYTSNKKMGFYFGFALEKAFRYFQLAFNLGHKENNNAIYKVVDHEQQLHFSVGSIIPLISNFDLTAEFYKDTPYDSDNDQSPSELNMGLRYASSNESAIFAGVGTGSLSEDDATDLRAYVGYKYYPSSKTKSVKIKKEEKAYGKFYKLFNIYFETGSSKVSEIEMIKLEQMFKIISNDPYISKLVVEGYTSKLGSAKFNKNLSAKRVKSVVEYITKRGFDSKIVQEVSYGDLYADSENLNKNTDRKVMFRIYRNK